MPGAFAAALLVLCVLVPVAQATPRAGRVAALSDQVARLDGRLDAVSLTYAQTAQRLDQLRQGVRATRRELRLTRYDLGVAKAGLRVRVVALYKERPVDLLDVVMGSASFEELLGRLTRMEWLTDADTKLVASIERAQERLRDEQATLTDSIARVQATMAAAAAERSRLEAALAERKSLLTRLRRAAPVRAQRLVRPPAEKPTPPVTVAVQGAWWPAIQAAAAQDGVDARGLYRLMLVESGGVATARNGRYMGLFQYSAATWRGDWNPWRAQDIFDGAAQVRASARAVKLGYGPSFWPNTYGYAFSG
jgi:hypothetical protein